MGIIDSETFDLLNKEIDELKKKVIVKSEGDDVLTIELMGSIKMAYEHMGRELIKINEQYGEKE